MINKIIAKQLKIEVEEVQPKHHIFDDLGADSLDLVEIVLAVEESCDITIADEDAEGFKTVQDILDHVG
jgi:acyl carrier protein|tara:strand:- start:406 stop:612 length:207 start_codon:yes stop_codon:yes gene_type:complete